MTTKDQVNEFLENFKSEVKKSGFKFVRRKKNFDYLTMLGLFIHETESLVVNLTENEYVEGPAPDDDGTEGQVWKFCAEVEGYRTYIKLKLDSKGATCISFHGLEYDVVFPFKKGKL